jgi:hypothetical protein
MAAGGPPAAVEAFWVGYVAGGEGWSRLSPALRERLRATAGTLSEVELGAYERNGAEGGVRPPPPGVHPLGDGLDDLADGGYRPTGRRTAGLCVARAQRAVDSDVIDQDRGAVVAVGHPGFR